MSQVIEGFKLTFSGSDLVKQAAERAKYHDTQEKYFVGVRIKHLTEQAKAAGISITEEEVRADDPTTEESEGAGAGNSNSKVRNFQTYMVSNKLRGSDEVSSATYSISFHRGRRGFFNLVAKHIEEASTYRLAPTDLETYEFEA